LINVFFIIGLIITVSGAIIAVIAEYLPINPFIGFRIGYTYSSKKIWIKYNRYAGISFAIIGLVIMALSLIIESITFLTIILLTTILTTTITLALLVAHESEKELGKQAYEIEKKKEQREEKIMRINPVIPSPPRLILMILPPILSIILSLYCIPLLPQKVPVHFDINGYPDRWEPLSTFTTTTLPVLIALQFIGLIIVLVELKAPLTFYKPGLPKKKVVELIYDIGIIVAWAMFIALTNTYYYATKNSHIIPTQVYTAIMLFLIAFIIIRVIKIWQEWRKALIKLSY